MDATVHPSNTGDGAEKKPDDGGEGDDDPINMAFPTDSVGKAIIYIISFPLMAPLYLTLPDTRNKEWTVSPICSIPGK